MGGTTDPTSKDFLGGKGYLADPAGVFHGNPMGGKGNTPAPPDFAEAARIQAESSLQNTREQTRANRPNQYSQFGSSEWTQDANGNWTQRTNLAAPLAGAVSGLEDQVAANAGQPVMTGDDARRQAIDASYSESSRMMDPQWSQRSDALRAQLAGEGLSPTDEGYLKAIQQFENERTTAYGDARDRAIGLGTQAGAATFAQNLAARNAPYQELGQLRGLGNHEQFTAAGSAAPLQSLAAALQGYDAQLQGYGIQQAGKNSMMGGAAEVAPAIIKALL